MLGLKSDILELPKDVEIEIMKKYNLDTQERVDEAVGLMRDWIEKQEHFMKKDFATHYLISIIVACKGSLEKAKQRLEKLCTLKTVLPEFFDNVHPRELHGLEKLVGGVLPKLDNDRCRVYLSKNLGSGFSSIQYTNFFKEKIFMAEYIRHYDLCDGFAIVFDNRDINMIDLLAGFNLVETKNILTVLMEGYSMRMKSMHILVADSSSAVVYELLLNVFKAVLSEKLASRLYMHRNVDELFKYLPREIFPAEYGGQEMPLAELTEKWLNVIGSEEHMNLMKEMNQSKIDEKVKRDTTYYEELFGLPGSFRKLQVD